VTKQSKSVSHRHRICPAITAATGSTVVLDDWDIQNKLTTHLGYSSANYELLYCSSSIRSGGQVGSTTPDQAATDFRKKVAGKVNTVTVVQSANKEKAIGIVAGAAWPSSADTPVEVSAYRFQSFPCPFGCQLKESLCSHCCHTVATVEVNCSATTREPSVAAVGEVADWDDRERVDVVVAAGLSHGAGAVLGMAA
jgi:hypothetical protein